MPGIGNVTKSVSLSSFELTESEPQWFEWTGYLEKGYEPEVRFRNGTAAAKRLDPSVIEQSRSIPRVSTVCPDEILG